MTAAPVAVFSHLNGVYSTREHHSPFFYLYILAAITNSTYNYVWDVSMDWRLPRAGRDRWAVIGHKAALLTADWLLAWAGCTPAAASTPSPWWRTSSCASAGPSSCPSSTTSPTTTRYSSPSSESSRCSGGSCGTSSGIAVCITITSTWLLQGGDGAPELVSPQAAGPGHQRPRQAGLPQVPGLRGVGGLGALNCAVSAPRVSSPQLYCTVDRE